MGSKALKVRRFTVIEFIIVTEVCQLFKVKFVSENGTYATEAFDELIALRASVADEFKRGSEVFVVFGSDGLCQRSDSWFGGIV